MNFSSEDFSSEEEKEYLDEKHFPANTPDIVAFVGWKNEEDGNVSDSDNAIGAREESVERNNVRDDIQEVRMLGPIAFGRAGIVPGAYIQKYDPDAMEDFNGNQPNQ
eukprot:794134_1